MSSTWHHIVNHLHDALPDNWSDWGSIGGSAASIFGVVAFVQNVGDRRKRREQGRIDQARKCWYVETRRDTYWPNDTEPTLDVREFVALHNDSDEPIYDVAAWGVAWRIDSRDDVEYRAVSEVVGPKAIGPNGRAEVQIITRHHLTDRLALSDADGWEAELYMQFTDAADVRWGRHEKTIRELAAKNRHIFVGQSPGPTSYP